MLSIGRGLRWAWLDHPKHDISVVEPLLTFESLACLFGEAKGVRVGLFIPYKGKYTAVDGPARDAAVDEILKRRSDGRAGDNDLIDDRILEADPILEPDAAVFGIAVDGVHVPDGAG